MAYKKYIKRGGKVYGPYIYHSKRVDGKVVSEYHGPKKIDYKKPIIMGFGVLILIVLIYMLAFTGTRTTGGAILDLDANFQEGESLQGKLLISLKQGEFIPASSSLIFENSGDVYEFKLEDVLPSGSSEGDFYVEGTSISGTGIGYGDIGERQIYPEVHFILSILSEEPANTTETPIEEASAPMTGNAISNFFRFTGKVVVEFENEVEGIVSEGQVFSYSLEEGQRAELKPLSVSVGSEQLPDDAVEVVIEGNEVIVTTNYIEGEGGFGKEYLTEDYTTLEIDVSDLGLFFNEGDLVVRLTSSGEEIFSMDTYLGKKEVIAETPPEESILVDPEPVPEEPIIVVPESNLDLTSQERVVLESQFGNFLVEVSEAKEKKGFIIIRYELDDYWVEHSYDADLDDETLWKYMHEDQVKWLRDLAKKFSEPVEPEETLEELEGNYSV